jgi:hypothetical protein
MTESVGGQSLARVRVIGVQSIPPKATGNERLTTTNRSIPRISALITAMMRLAEPKDGVALSGMLMESKA